MCHRNCAGSEASEWIGFRSISQRLCRRIARPCQCRFLSCRSCINSFYGGKLTNYVLAENWVLPCRKRRQEKVEIWRAVGLKATQYNPPDLQMDRLQHIHPDVNLMDGHACFCHMDSHDVDLVDVIKYNKTRFGNAFWRRGRRTLLRTL